MTMIFWEIPNFFMIFYRSKHITCVLHGQQKPMMYILVNLVSGVVPLDCRSRSLRRYQSLASRTRDSRALHQKMPKTSKHINNSICHWVYQGFCWVQWELQVATLLLSLFVVDRNLLKPFFTNHKSWFFIYSQYNKYLEDLGTPLWLP